jgi:hypothetical protein
MPNLKIRTRLLITWWIRFNKSRVNSDQASQSTITTSISTENTLPDSSLTSGIPQIQANKLYPKSIKDCKNLNFSKSAKNKLDMIYSRNFVRVRINLRSSPTLSKDFQANLSKSLIRCVASSKAKSRKIIFPALKPKKKMLFWCKKLCVFHSKLISTKDFYQELVDKLTIELCRWNSDLRWTSSRTWWSIGRVMRPLIFWMKFLKRWRLSWCTLTSPSPY